MIPDEEEYPQQISVDCYYCNESMGNRDTDAAWIRLYSCHNHADITVHHRYYSSHDIPNSVNILYKLGEIKYDTFIAIKGEVNYLKNAMEIGYHHNFNYHILHLSTVPDNFVPEDLPNIIQHLLKLKAFL